MFKYLPIQRIQTHVACEGDFRWFSGKKISDLHIASKFYHMTYGKEGILPKSFLYLLPHRKTILAISMQLPSILNKYAFFDFPCIKYEFERLFMLKVLNKSAYFAVVIRKKVFLEPFVY